MGGQRVEVRSVVAVLLVTGLAVGVGQIHDDQAANDWTADAAPNIKTCDCDWDLGGGGGGGSGDTLSIFPTTSDAFSDAFPGYNLYLVANATRLPAGTWAVARNPDTGATFNITTEYNDLLSDADATIDDAGDAKLYGAAFAATGNWRIQTDRQVVNSSDSDELGVSVHDPKAWLEDTSWHVDLQTWTRENGVLADWRLKFTLSELDSAEWNVSHQSLGDHEKEVKAPNLRVNDTVTNTYGLTGHSLDADRQTASGWEDLLLPGEVDDLAWDTIETSQNFDNTSWKIQYPDGRSVPSDIAAWATDLANAGTHAYATQVEDHPDCGPDNPDPNWGFTSQTTNCNQTIRILPADALYPAAGLEAGNASVLYADQALPTWLGNHGVYTNQSEAEVAESVVAELHFQNLQYTRTQWDPFWPPLLNGQARLAGALANPATETDPSSLWTHAANQHQRHPRQGTCLQGAGSAPYWGFLYDGNAGVPFLSEALDAYADDAVTNGTDCRKDLEAVVNTTLDRLRIQGYETRHANQSQALANFTGFAYARNLTWSTPTSDEDRDWGAHMEPVAAMSTTLGRSEGSEVGAWGADYVDLPEEGVYNVSATCGADSGWTVRVLATRGDDRLAWGTVPCGESRNVSTLNHTDLHLVAARTDATPADYTAETGPFPATVTVETDLESMEVDASTDFTTTIRTDDLNTTFETAAGPVQVEMDDGVCSYLDGDLVGCLETSDGIYTAYTGPHVAVIPPFDVPRSRGIDCKAHTAWGFAWGEAREDDPNPDPDLLLETNYTEGAFGDTDDEGDKPDERFTKENPTPVGTHNWSFEDGEEWYNATYELYDNRTDPGTLLDESSVRIERHETIIIC